MMRFLYFSGCVMPYRAPNYDLSSRRILEHFGVELVDMPDAGCCGIYVRQVDEFKSLVLSARIWAKAEAAGLDILSPCPGCVSTLTHVRDRLVSDEKLKREVNASLTQAGQTFKGTGNVKHLLRVLEEDIGLDTIREAIVSPLSVDLAAHYGCHLVRPADELEFQDPEVPQILDQLIEMTGARSLEYHDKMGCCGMNVHGNEVVRLRLAGHKLLDVQAAGAQAMVMACPACYLAMGLNQRSIEKSWERRFDLPVVHLPQLLGLALGLDSNSLGLSLNRPKVDSTMLEAWADGEETV